MPPITPTTLAPPSSLQAPPRLRPSASYSFTMRVHAPQAPGSFARVATAIGDQGAGRGAIDLVRARTVDQEMKLAAARAIAGVITGQEPHREYIVPGVFDRCVGEPVADAVAHAALATGVARRETARRTAHEVEAEAIR